MTYFRQTLSNNNAGELSNFVIYDKGKPVFTTNDPAVFQTEIRNPIYAGGSSCGFVYESVNLTFDNTETVVDINFFKETTITGTFGGTTKDIRFFDNATIDCTTGNLTGNFIFFQSATVNVTNPGGVALLGANLKFLSDCTINIGASANSFQNSYISNINTNNISRINISSDIVINQGGFEGIKFVTSNNARLITSTANYVFNNCVFDFSSNVASPSAPLVLRANNAVISASNCTIYAPNQAAAVIQINGGNAGNKFNITNSAIIKPTPATIFAGTLFFRSVNIEAVAP
jgi:hypothetical protein